MYSFANGLATSESSLVESGNSAGDDDFLQCGKCKAQFSAVELFMSHKKMCGLKTHSTDPKNVGSDVPCSPGQLVLEPPSASLGSNVIHLSESDILSLIPSNHNISLHSNENSNPLNTDSLSVLTGTVPTSDGMGGSSPSGNTTSTLISGQSLGFPHLSFITTGNQLVPGTSFLVTTGGPDHTAEISSVTIPPNIVLNISSNPVLSLSPSLSSSSTNNNEKGQHKKQKSVGSVHVLSDLKLHKSKLKKRLQKSVQVSEKEKNPPTPPSVGTESGIPVKKIAKLECTFCQRCFSKNFDLQQHIRCHTGEKPFQCVVCGRAFAQKSNVKKHMQTHKVWPDGLARTLPMGQDDDSQEAKQYHHLTHQQPHHYHINVQHQVNHHQAENDAGNGAKRGLKVITTPVIPKKPEYVCPYCSFTAKTFFELKTHLCKSHKKEKVYKCIQSSCGKMFGDLDPFLEHIQTHENEMTYRCHQCPKSFTTLYDLGSHQYSHSLYPNQTSRISQKYYRCQKCLNKYTTPAALEHHLATSTHHYPCPQCNKVFPCERYLRRHLLTHGSGLHICQFCDKTFKTSNYLKVHMVIHTGEKPFACNTCSATFNRRDKLKRHKLVHDPIKKFKCPFKAHTGCPKEFNRPDKLKAHILTHSGIKPHHCPHCGRSFSRRAHLRSHVAAHTNPTSQDNPEGALTATDVSLTADLSSGQNYITLYDCKSCGRLFTSEHTPHECVEKGSSGSRLTIVQSSTGGQDSNRSGNFELQTLSIDGLQVVPHLMTTEKSVPVSKI